MRSKTYMSKINLQRRKLTVESRKSREIKTWICSEVSVNSPGNPWSTGDNRNVQKVHGAEQMADIIVCIVLT